MYDFTLDNISHVVCDSHVLPFLAFYNICHLKFIPCLFYYVYMLYPHYVAPVCAEIIRNKDFCILVLFIQRASLKHSDFVLSFACWDMDPSCNQAIADSILLSNTSFMSVVMKGLGNLKPVFGLRFS